MSAGEQLAHVNQEIDALLQILKQEGVIDGQFEQLLLLQDDSDPDFVKNVMEMYCQDSRTAMENIHNMLVQPSPDFNHIDQAVHQLKGSAASFGAYTVTTLCVQLRQACQAGQQQPAVALIRNIVQAQQLLEQKLQAFTTLEARKKELEAQM